MPQGKLKVKVKLPVSVKSRNVNKKHAATKKGANRPVPSKMKKNAESQKLKKMLVKTINESAERELRSKALGGNGSLSSSRNVNSRKELPSKRN